MPEYTNARAPGKDPPLQVLADTIHCGVSSIVSTAAKAVVKLLQEELTSRLIDPIPGNPAQSTNSVAVTR